MTFKKLSIIPFFAILFVFGTYIYGSYKDSAEAKVKQVPQENREAPVGFKEAKIAKEKIAEPLKFKPISESAPVPKVEPRVETELDPLWKEERALHQAEIERLQGLQKNFPENSDEYREIESKILFELQEMGEKEYDTAEGGLVIHPPDYEAIGELSKQLDSESQAQFATEISAVENLVSQREKIDAEMTANRRGELENPLELIEMNQKLVAQEFRFVRENQKFFEELYKHD